MLLTACRTFVKRCIVENQLKMLKTSSISFDTIASTIAAVYRQETPAPNHFDLPTGVQSPRERNTSVCSPSTSITSRSISPQSPITASPWICHIENPERQSALKKMKIITSVTIALSLEVITPEQLIYLMRGHTLTGDKGLGSIRLLSPENELLFPASEPSCRRALRKVAGVSDSSASPLEPSTQQQQPQTATEALVVDPQPPACLRTVLEFPVKSRFYAFNCSR
ncbi:unnamed protein product [Dibothriocephalus latus]|uniref:Uncharacterized protein n=1 Tax=Dibothriocephalus latus TaxID=60516 RepID=A0A3P6PKN5_DIBLA|nr:unnamed protein product [Dibothriocephalus latus]